MAQRHQALKSCSARLIVILNLFLFPFSCLAAGQEKSVIEIQELLDEVSRQHGLDVIWEDPDTYKVAGLSFQKISPRDLPRFLVFLRHFKEELLKYPAGFFKPSGLTKIVLVNKLFKGDLPARGVYSMPQGYMYFDIYRDFRNKEALRHGVHHEIYHMISTSLWIDPQILPDGWDMLNEPGFRYAGQGKVAEPPQKVNRFSPGKGFATDYGMTSAEEDKAEIFACLMMDSQRRIIEGWGKTDPVLAEKIAVMKKIIQQYAPSMDASFWGDSHRE